jgi:hypothetical protein
VFVVAYGYGAAMDSTGVVTAVIVGGSTFTSDDVLSWRGSIMPGERGSLSFLVALAVDLRILLFMISTQHLRLVLVVETHDRAICQRLAN